MKQYQDKLDELIELSRWLGSPQHDCTILGEGNTSVRVGDDTFLVKASGTELGTAGEDSFLEIDFSRTLAMLEETVESDEAANQLLAATKVDGDSATMPSVETPLHAICLSLPGVNYVGHTHPTAINAITCSTGFREILSHRIFPDEIVVCGPEPLLVPYIDPGTPLAILMKRELDSFCQRTGTPPKTIYLQNHGFIALGASAKQVKAITSMAVKAARIRIGAVSLGGIQPMDSSDIERIEHRPDEHYRQNIIHGKPIT